MGLFFRAIIEKIAKVEALFTSGDSHGELSETEEQRNIADRSSGF